MNQSRVLAHLNFLIFIRDARNRRVLLHNMTISQTKAITVIAKCIVSDTIRVYRRDVPKFESKRLLLKKLASYCVSCRRKKSLLLTHHSILLILLREVYLVQTIVDELQTVRHDPEQQ